MTSWTRSGVEASMYLCGVLLLLWVCSTAGGTVGDAERRDTGDTFTIDGDFCDAKQCTEHGAGQYESTSCVCSCPQRAPLFREDRELCVDDLSECSLATFGTGNSGVQKIPFVFLPLKGQIIHPSKEITFQGVKTPICAVSGAQFLTRKGFMDLRNTLDADVPFSLFRDEGRTFLQWSGEDELRTRMSGRVMVVRLLCRDIAATPATPLDLRGVFTPCVAFRVQGTSVRQLTNVTEVQFATNTHASVSTTSTGLSVSEYIAIGISSVLLGLIYVASVFLYLHIKKRRKAALDESTRRKFSKGLKKKDGTSITEHDIVRINNERIQTLSNAMIDGGENGVVKKNPLLTIGRQYQDLKNNFPSDSGSNLSDSEDYPDNNEPPKKRFNTHVTAAVIHPNYREFKLHNELSIESGHRDESSIERLPDEHVSIVETTDDREIARPVGTTRRKLYFNPAYFEPHLMAEPPEAALEFLTKIREVISIAKHKMTAKRFQPVLNQIPEEETYPSGGNSIDLYNGLGSQRSGSVVSLKRENSRKQPINCLGCPGCKLGSNTTLQNMMNYDIPSCVNCMKNNRGDKQNSIRKWLENIPSIKQSPFHSDTLSNFTPNNSLANSLLSLPLLDKSKIRKQNSFNEERYSVQSVDGTTGVKKSSTLSVRSEPPIRSYNLPLPEFDSDQCSLSNVRYYGQTVSRVDDIRPVGLSDYRSDSYRCNPLKNQRKNKFITNKNALPDMVSEAIALEHCVKTYSSSDEERLYKKIALKSKQTETLRNSESPSGNDYETDSLERSTNKKGCTTTSDYADVPSSQASPSLSNALPLEEELTIQNDVYKRASSHSNTPSPKLEITKSQNHYETIGKKRRYNGDDKTLIKSKNDYSLVSEVYVNNNYNFGSTPTSPSGSECSMGSRKTLQISQDNKKSPIKPGCLTIEVKDSAENYIKIHESDSFDPDTLDRKSSKQKEMRNLIQFSRKGLLNNIDISHSDNPPQQIQLRSSGTFKKSSNNLENNNKVKFSSLRGTSELLTNTFSRPKLSPNLYSGSKSLEDKLNEDENTCDWETEEGRILTLEMRHSKRQRQCTPPSIKQQKSLARPDVLPPLPPTEDPIYEQPIYPPRRVERNHTLVCTDKKNLNGRSLTPRSIMNNTETENFDNSFGLQHGHPCSPLRASVSRTNTFNFDYENIEPVITKHNECRVSTRMRCSKNSKEINTVNTNTYIKPHKDDNPKHRIRRRKGSTIDDSGYLSSDSTSSRPARKLVITKIVSCSESDDTENEARSESGAESIETHSVFFGSFRKLQTTENNNGFNRSKRDNFKRSSSKKSKLNKIFST